MVRDMATMDVVLRHHHGHRGRRRFHPNDNLPRRISRTTTVATTTTIAILVPVVEGEEYSADGDNDGIVSLVEVLLEIEEHP